MSKLTVVLFVAALSLACASAQTPKQAAALKQAHEAGVLSDAEYQQKLQALRTPPTPSPRTAAAIGKGNTWHMKRATFKENTTLDAMPRWGLPGHPGHVVDALAMMIPMDWTLQAGNGTGPYDCNMTSGRILVLAASPEKSSGVAIVPGRATIWSNDRGLLQSIQQTNQRYHAQMNCVIQQPQPLASLIAGIAIGLSKELRVTGEMEPVPGLSEKLPAIIDQANRNLAQQGAHVEATAGRIPVTGNESGVPTEGFFTVLQVVKTERLQTGATVVTTDYPMQVGTFAPQGKYAAIEPMLNAMLDSVVIDPEYAAESAQVSSNVLEIHRQTDQNLQRIQSQMAADNANAARQQAQIRAGVQSYANQVHDNVAANRSAALDHSTQQFALHMGDEAIYKDPSTGARVQMSNQYNHAWASGNGNEYILTDSASFNPNGQVGSSSWTQLQQEK